MTVKRASLLICCFLGLFACTGPNEKLSRIAADPWPRGVEFPQVTEKIRIALVSCNQANDKLCNFEDLGAPLWSDLGAIRADKYDAKFEVYSVKLTYVGAEFSLSATPVALNSKLPAFGITQNGGMILN